MLIDLGTLDLLFRCPNLTLQFKRLPGWLRTVTNTNLTQHQGFISVMYPTNFFFLTSTPCTFSPSHSHQASSVTPPSLPATESSSWLPPPPPCERTTAMRIYQRCQTHWPTLPSRWGLTFLRWWTPCRTLCWPRGPAHCTHQAGWRGCCPPCSAAAPPPCWMPSRPELWPGPANLPALEGAEDHGKLLPKASTGPGNTSTYNLLKRNLVIKLHLLTNSVLSQIFYIWLKLNL